MLKVIVADARSSEQGTTGMNALTRRPNGTMLPGHTPNPGGRPRSTIEQVREALLPDLPLFLERLAELTQSSNETIRLQALREWTACSASRRLRSTVPWSRPISARCISPR